MKVHFPEDLLKGQEKRKYRKASKVKKYNIYEQDIKNIPKLHEHNITRKFLETITSFHPIHDLAEHFEIHLDEFTNLLKSFNVEVER